MVGPVSPFSSSPGRKKGTTKKDGRLKKIVSNLSGSLVGVSAKSSPKKIGRVREENASLATQRTSAIAKKKALLSQTESVRAQKSAFLSERAHLARQAAAIRKAIAEEKAKRKAEETIREEARQKRLRSIQKIRSYSQKKDREYNLEKYLKKKKSRSSEKRQDQK